MKAWEDKNITTSINKIQLISISEKKHPESAKINTKNNNIIVTIKYT